MSLGPDASLETSEQARMRWQQRLDEMERYLHERALRRAAVVCEPCAREEHLLCVRPCTCTVRVREAT